MYCRWCSCQHFLRMSLLGILFFCLLTLLAVPFTLWIKPYFSWDFKIASLSLFDWCWHLAAISSPHLLSPAAFLLRRLQQTFCFWFARDKDSPGCLSAVDAVSFPKSHIKLFVTLSYCSYSKWRWLIYPNCISKFNSRVKVSNALGRWRKGKENLKGRMSIDTVCRQVWKGRMVICTLQCLFDWSSIGSRPLCLNFFCTLSFVC